MKNKLKIIIGIFIAIFVLVICGIFIKKENDIEIIEPIKIISDEKIVKNYNNILSNIDSKSKIDDCNKIEQKNLSKMCKDIIEDRFSEEKKFTKLDQCNELYDGKTEKEKQKLSICRYNVALSNIKTKSDIYKCEKIGDKTFESMCTDIIKNRYKF